MNIRPWTEVEECRMAILCWAGMSASEIAEHLDRSRNSIIGKANRLGLQLHGDHVAGMKRYHARRRGEDSSTRHAAQ